ncbi:MAG: hypothetical protein M0Z56_12745 [Desulfobacteraceae bacterium]|nr:hypothetical protein [Desulfobacteraceae bacterium]
MFNGIQIQLGFTDVQIINMEQLAFDVEIQFPLQKTFQIFVNKKVILVFPGVLAKLFQQDSFVVFPLPKQNGSRMLFKIGFQGFGCLLIEPVLYVPYPDIHFLFIRKTSVFKENI